MTQWIQTVFLRSRLRRLFYILTGAIALGMLLIFAQTGKAHLSASPAPQIAQAEPSSPVLFENVRLFDGTSPNLSEPSYVLVEGNKIQTTA